MAVVGTRIEWSALGGMEMKFRALLALVLGTLVPMVALAQTERLLKPEEINEKALVELLAPEETGAPAKRRTRSINVTREESAQPAAKPAAASLLITFETNSAGLTPAGKQSLDVVGRALSSEKLSSYRFAIEGHSDPRGGSTHWMAAPGSDRMLEERPWPGAFHKQHSQSLLVRCCLLFALITP